MPCGRGNGPPVRASPGEPARGRTRGRPSGRAGVPTSPSRGEPPEQVPLPPERVDELWPGGAVDRVAEVRHVALDHVRELLPLRAVEVVEDLLLRDDLSGAEG